jgi:enoyl-CoA hydratase
VIERVVDNDGIAILTLDDGKVNAFHVGFFDALDAAFDTCADDAAVVLVGRPGCFSAGLDVKLLAALDGGDLRTLLTRFGESMLRVWLEPRPVVAAATGHAIAGGTILAMASDHAVAADGDFRWGLNETAIGLALPEWIIALARANVRPDRLEGLALAGALVDPATAVEVGYASALAPPDAVRAAAVERARRLAALPRAAYAATKQRLRAAAAQAAHARMADDLDDLLTTVSGR